MVETDGTLQRRVSDPEGGIVPGTNQPIARWVYAALSAHCTTIVCCGGYSSPSPSAQRPRHATTTLRARS